MPDNMIVGTEAALELVDSKMLGKITSYRNMIDYEEYTVRIERPVFVAVSKGEIEEIAKSLFARYGATDIVERLKSMAVKGRRV
jgi:hypothetical protein